MWTNSFGLQPKTILYWMVRNAYLFDTDKIGPIKKWIEISVHGSFFYFYFNIIQIATNSIFSHGNKSC